MNRWLSPGRPAAQVVAADEGETREGEDATKPRSICSRPLLIVYASSPPRGLEAQQERKRDAARGAVPVAVVAADHVGEHGAVAEGVLADGGDRQAGTFQRREDVLDGPAELAAFRADGIAAVGIIADARGRDLGRLVAEVAVDSGRLDTVPVEQEGERVVVE